MSSVTGKMVDFIRDEDIYSSSPSRPSVSRLVESPSSSSPRANATHQLKHQLDLNGVYTKEILDKDKTIENLGIAIQQQRDTIAYLRNKLQLRKGVIEDQEQQLEQVTNDRTRLQTQVLDLQTERTNLQNDVDALQKQFSASEDVNDNLQKTTLALQKLLDARSQTEKLLRDELADMTALRVELSSTLSARDEQLDALKLTLKKQRDEITQIQSDHQIEIDELECGIRELQAARQRTLADEMESATQKDQLLELQQTLTVAQEKSAEIQADLSQSESLVARLQEISIQREADYAQLQQELQQSAQDCQTYRTTISELTQRLTDANCHFQQQHADLSREISSLSAQLVTMGNEKQLREDELTSSMAQMSEEYRQSMADTIRDMQGQMEACKSRLDGEIVNLTSRLSEVMKEKEEIRSAMALVVQDLDLQKQNSEAKEIQIVSLMTRLAETAKDNELRMGEIADLRGRWSELSKEKDEIRSAMALVIQDLDLQKQDSETKNARITDLTVLLMETTKENEIKMGEIGNMTTRWSEVTRENEEIRSAMALVVHDLDMQKQDSEAKNTQIISLTARLTETTKDNELRIREVAELSSRWSEVIKEKEEIRSAMALVIRDFELQKQDSEAKDTQIVDLATRLTEITKEKELRMEELRLAGVKRTEMEEAFRLRSVRQDAEMVKEKSALKRLLDSKDVEMRTVLGELAVVRREAAAEVAALERELEVLRRADACHGENFNSSQLSHYNLNSSEFGSVILPSILSNSTTPSFDNLSQFSTEHRLLHMATQEEADCMESKGIPTLRGSKIQAASIAQKTTKPSPGFFYSQDMDPQQRQLELDARNAKRLPHLRTNHPLEARNTKWRISTPRRSVSCEQLPRAKTPPTPHPKTPKKTFREKAVNAKDKLRKVMQSNKIAERLNESVSSVSRASPSGRSAPLFANAMKHKASVAFKIDNTPKRQKKV